jgi:flavorubredoxin
MNTIDTPTQWQAQYITDQWTLLPSWLPVPGMGVLPVNSFLLKGKEPILVDTGLAALGDAYLEMLEQEIDLADLRWIWLSHMDTDHSGNLQRVLDKAPLARVVTSFLGMGKMNLAGLDVSRVHLLEPGDVFEAGGQRLVSLRPPYYDAPETLGFFDQRERALFVADCFGALLPHPAHKAESIEAAHLRDGLVGWSAIDAPWLAITDRVALGRILRAIERLDPNVLLCGHLPVVRHGIKALTGIVAEAYANQAVSVPGPLSLEQIAAASAHSCAA